MSLQAGDRLGPYEILSPLGKGGMGEVFRARDPRVGRDVAIKVSAGSFTERFANEARAIAALNHPNICTLFDVGPNYLVMELVEGDPLKGPLPVEEAVRLAGQMADALAEAHRKGILHRDLKPGNILVTARGVKLLDFGLAKDISHAASQVTLTMEGTVLGTAAYMSPEQALAKDVDARSDVFSFGAVLYEMLAGRRAFGGDSMLEILSAVVKGDVAALQAPEAVTKIVTRCLKKAPAERFRSMEEVRDALQSVTLKADPGPEDRPSIAVLPFANMSRDAEDEYFSDGLAEEIINTLAQVSGLKVIARTSAFAFKGKNEDVRKIAETLGVATVLEGSVRRSGSRIRVMAQLIAAADGAHLWSQRYDREMTEIFAVQDEIAAAIAGALHGKLGTAPVIKARYTPSLPAYEAYLKARHLQWQLAPDALIRCREFFKEAIALDPQFAQAHVGLADSHLLGAVLGLTPATDVTPLARAEAEKALRIDPTHSEAHAMMGIIRGIFEFEWEEARQHFEKALSREPVSPLVRAWYGIFYLRVMGRAEEELEQQRLALQENPLEIQGRLSLAQALTSVGKFEEAEALLDQAIEMHPNIFTPMVIKAALCVSLERWTEAESWAEKAYALAPWHTSVVGILAGVLMRKGNEARAQELIKRFGDGSAYGAPLGLAAAYIYGGNLERAWGWLGKAIDQRHPAAILFAMFGPETLKFRSTPEWRALAKKIRLPGY